MSDLARMIGRWGANSPTLQNSFKADAEALERWLELGDTLSAELNGREPTVVRARAQWRGHLRQALAPFFRMHLADVLRSTEGATVTELIASVRQRFPRFAPSPAELAHDAGRPLHSKVGFEYKSAILLAQVLADRTHGSSLFEAARRPTPAAREQLEHFRATDRLELPGARLLREGNVGYVEICSPDFLNAEDEDVLQALEMCVDLVLLDERIEVGVLRGAVVRNAKYSGRRVFCSGINLSRLYRGELGYLYYVQRELGLLSKIYRGLSLDRGAVDLEKPWIGVVDTHAIGGGFQLLLVMDYVLAERSAMLLLPARREGILPGAAAVRIVRYVGALAARRIILMSQQMPVESELGSRLVDRVVAPHEMTSAIAQAVQSFVESGQVSLAGNRKALRLATEPEALFLDCMSHFALAQADCHFSPALIDNLEQHWVNANNR